MTKDEALRVLERYGVYGCGVCLQDGIEHYQIENGSATLYLDAEEALKLAIDALKTEAIPIEWIEEYMDKLDSNISKYTINSMVHRWKAEREEE